MLTSASHTTEPELLASIFEERAEFLSAEELDAWTTTTPRDTEILAKLRGPGTKLLTGPRGSGKSTLLRRAYFDLLEGSAVMPAYVNYARSLALEPLFHRRADALQIFRQWILMKIVVGVREALDERKVRLPKDLAEIAAVAATYIDDLQHGNDPQPLTMMLGPAQLVARLEDWTHEVGRRRCVLLLDDAAHAFSPDQQREFFEIFRELRSRVVAAKAAVYPGITSYSPHFHVGHDAELVEAWSRPEDSEFLPMMRDIVNRRLPPPLLEALSDREELVDYLAFASFGIPRGFLVMLSDLLGLEESSTSTPTRRAAERAISTHAASVISIFESLADKLPRFRNFVEVGLELERAVASSLRNYNIKREGLDQKAVVIGIREPLGPELTRILSMLEYAGVLRRMSSISRGTRGVFHRYVLHYALVIDDNCLGLGGSFPLSSLLGALKTRDAHAFAQTRPSTLLGKGYAQRCTLDLAPCQYCGAPRVSEDAAFCMRCGRELQNVSIYEELLRASIRQLPLTENKLQGLLAKTKIRTIQDVLLDDDSVQLHSVPYIGSIWAARIRNYAEEFVSV